MFTLYNQFIGMGRWGRLGGFLCDRGEEFGVVVFERVVFLRRAALALSLLLLTGCASAGESAEPTPVVVPTVAAPTNAPESATATNPAAPGSAQPEKTGPSPAAARQLAAESKWQESAQVWEAVAKQAPSADVWNEAAYAWLQAGDVQRAMEAGNRALQINSSHPFALYNAGTAHLKLGDSCIAALRFNYSSMLQPDRWEPALALAEALAMAGNGTAATEPLQRAILLGAPSDAVAPIQSLVASVDLPLTPAELEQKGKLAAQVDDLRFYWIDPGRPCKPGGSPIEYWVVKAGEAHRLWSVVQTIKEAQLLTILPNDDPIYVLWAGVSPVYVARANQYYLLRFRAGAPELVRFERAADRFPQALMTNSWALHSSQPPRINASDEVLTSHGNPASGKTTINLTWQIDWAKGLGALSQLAEDQQDPNK